MGVVGFHSHPETSRHISKSKEIESNMPLSDNEIIKNIRRGEKHYFARLVDRYKDRAMTLGIRMLKDRQDAEEATQDAFIRAYNALDRFEGASKLVHGSTVLCTMYALPDLEKGKMNLTSLM